MTTLLHQMLGTFHLLLGCFMFYHLCHWDLNYIEFTVYIIAVKFDYSFKYHRNPAIIVDNPAPGGLPYCGVQHKPRSNIPEVTPQSIQDYQKISSSCFRARLQLKCTKGSSLGARLTSLVKDTSIIHHTKNDLLFPQVPQRSRACGEQRATLQELLRWRRSVCDGRPDWQNAWLHTNTSPTLTVKTKSPRKKASPQRLWSS